MIAPVKKSSLSLWQRVTRTLFNRAHGYNASTSTRRRGRRQETQVRAEHYALDYNDRQRVIATLLDFRRNNPVVASICRLRETDVVGNGIMAQAQSGDVLVVDMSGDCGFGPFGEILASACQQRGIAGLVLDGSVRDGADIEALGFPVFCRGLAPSGTRKEHPGELGGSIQCGGASVNPGDIIVAGRDGVIVIPTAAMSGLQSRLQQIVEKETRIKQGIAAGKTTLELLKLS